MNNSIGNTLNFISSENNINCVGIITAIIITAKNTYYKVKVDKSDVNSINEYIKDCYDHRPYPYEVIVCNNKDITDDFSFEFIG